MLSRVAKTVQHTRIVAHQNSDGCARGVPGTEGSREYQASRSRLFTREQPRGAARGGNHENARSPDGRVGQQRGLGAGFKRNLHAARPERHGADPESSRQPGPIDRNRHQHHRSHLTARGSLQRHRSRRHDHRCAGQSVLLPRARGQHADPDDHRIGRERSTGRKHRAGPGIYPPVNHHPTDNHQTQPTTGNPITHNHTRQTRHAH